jgi:crotonobetainyl-CoA:carnitine CoA-transferase CaiB-like acyl-CoA transferase
MKVLDLTTWWAGPSATALLALLGADVVHVESTRHVDGVRMTGGMFAPRPDWWELSAFFLQVNLNKRDLTIDLGMPAGRELALQLIAGSDLIVENFTPRVLEGFDLAQDAVRRTNPAAVFVRMPAFGLAGPWRDRPGFAQTMEQMSGLAWLTGHVDDQPRIQRGPCDPNGGLHAAFAALVALHHRDRTGDGAFIEAPMFEAALNVAAEQTVEYTAYGNLMQRDGNRSPWAAPQGIYACSGVEEWLAVAVEDDEHWRALCKVVGRDDWAGDPALGSHDGRRQHHDRLDEGLIEWAATQPLADAVDALLAVGVPAGAATDPRRGRDHPQMSVTGYFEQVAHPVAGTHATPTAPFRFRSIDTWVTSYAPTLGEHNAEVLGELGLGPDDLARLEADGVIGTRPVGV